MKAIMRRFLQPLRHHPEFFIAIRNIFRPGRAIYQHLHFQGPFVVPVSDHASFNINHYGNQIENELFWAGFGRGYEGNELRLWRALVELAEFVADVGANTGVYALAAAALKPNAQIVALEPVPRVYEKLVANLELNSFGVRALQIAASDADGEAVLYDTDDEHTYSASLDATMLHGAETLRVPVRASRLDSLFEEIGWPRIDLLKIDVEKHEPAVLAGMPKRLVQDRPTMLIEILDNEIGEAVFNLVKDLDYRFFAIDDSKGLIETQKLGASVYRNFLLCRSELWAGCGARIQNALAAAPAERARA